LPCLKDMHGSKLSVYRKIVHQNVKCGEGFNDPNLATFISSVFQTASKIFQISFKFFCSDWKLLNHFDWCSGFEQVVGSRGLHLQHAARRHSDHVQQRRLTQGREKRCQWNQKDSTMVSETPKIIRTFNCVEKMFHGFWLMKWDDYFRVAFDHFLIKCHS